MIERTAAIVLCAGKGTRMRSELPKVLHPILGRALCVYPILRANEAGADPVVAVVGHQAEEVEAALRRELPEAPLRFALQEQQRGTADAVTAARPALEGFEGTVLILSGDAPLLDTATLRGLLSTHREGGAPLTVVTSKVADPKGYGRIVREGGKPRRIVEEKDCDEAQRTIREVNAGLYAVEASFLWRALEGIDSDNAQGELYLTDLLAIAAKEASVETFEVPFELTAGINDRVELAQRTRVLQSRINEGHMRAGVTFEDPTTTWIAEGVAIEQDAVLGPQVSLRGATRIGKGARIGQGCVLTDAVVGEGVELRPYSILEEARVGPACQVGPFARLRPGSELGRGAHVGNFVETKKTRMGDGAKANHLAYLGDADIGARVNVGAGTITCNYDGKNKHRTVLEDEVFIGSDSQLVAPVRVGKGAYVGAGSTITRDVPAMSLALSRPEQVVKEGWVERLRARREAEARELAEAAG